MDSYCVIHFKDKPEKVKIFNFLAAETEAKFIVTADMKEYVAKMFNVTILEKNEEVSNVRNVNFDAATIQNVVQALQNINPTNNITHPPIDTLPTEQQYSSTPIVSPTTIVEHQRVIETATVVKDNPVNNIVGMVTRTIDTLSTEQQYPSAPIVPPSPIDINVVDQQVSVVEQQHELIETTIKNEVVNNIVDVMPVIVPSSKDNNMDTNRNTGSISTPIDEYPQNLMNMEDYGTYVPYRDRMVEPKEETIEDEMVEVVNHSVVSDLVEMEEDVTEEIIATNEDAPSSSRRSGRITKRPNYSMDEDTEESAVRKADVPSTSRRSERITKKPKHSMDSESDNESDYISEGKKNENNADKCQKCGVVCLPYRNKTEHVMMHAKIMKYECLVDKCGHKSIQKPNITKHMKKKHMASLECFKQVELTRDQMDKTDELMKEYFPGSTSGDEKDCQVCNQSIGGKSTNTSFKKRQHALHHIDFMLYKCMENGCQFECKEKGSMKQHLIRIHGESAKENFQTNKLTKEQELEIKEMVVKCFPKIGTNCEEADGSEK